MSDHEIETPVSKPGGKLAWVFGGILLISGFAMLVSSAIISGLLTLFVGILVFPLSRASMEKQSKKELKNKEIGITAVICLVIAMIALPAGADNASTPSEPTNTNQVAQEQVNTNVESAPAPVEEKKAEEAPVVTPPTPEPAPAPMPEPTPAPEPVAPAPVPPSKLDQLWSSLDTSIKKREGYDIKWNEGEGIVTVSYNAKDFWDETSLVRDGYSDLVKYGREAFKIDGVKDVEVEIYTELTDSMGQQRNERVMGVQMTKDVFQKFNWDNLSYSPIYTQMQSNAVYNYIHPAIMKNVNKDKLYLAL